MLCERDMRVVSSMCGFLGIVIGMYYHEVMYLIAYHFFKMFIGVFDLVVVTSCMRQGGICNSECDEQHFG